jgi:hypothetical protein
MMMQARWGFKVFMFLLDKFKKILNLSSSKIRHRKIPYIGIHTHVPKISSFQRKNYDTPPSRLVDREQQGEE